MELIDWRLAGFGAVWTFGLAVNLAALSLADFERQRRKSRFREVWARRGFQTASNLGLACFCLGLAGLANTVWEALLWGALAAAFGLFGWRSWRAKV
jgi:hypothetical protein